MRIFPVRSMMDAGAQSCPLRAVQVHFLSYSRSVSPVSPAASARFFPAPLFSPLLLHDFHSRPRAVRRIRRSSHAADLQFCGARVQCAQATCARSQHKRHAKHSANAEERAHCCAAVLGIRCSAFPRARGPRGAVRRRVCRSGSARSAVPVVCVSPLFPQLGHCFQFRQRRVCGHSPVASGARGPIDSARIAHQNGYEDGIENGKAALETENARDGITTKATPFWLTLSSLRAGRFSLFPIEIDHTAANCLSNSRAVSIDKLKVGRNKLLARCMRAARSTSINLSSELIFALARE